MNALVIEVRRGKDGKVYPLRMPIPERDRWRAIRLAHVLVHGQRMSIRQAQRAMLDQHGVKRSLGIIHHDLNRYTCERCGPVVTVDD